MKRKLLLLHGALGSSAYFKLLASILEEHYDILTLDFSGHGSKKFSQKGFSIEVFAQEVFAFLEEKAIEKIDIFGYSMGGYVAVYLAHKHPEKVAKIFTLGTKWDWNPESSEREAQMLNPEIVIEKVPKWAQSLKELHGENWPELMQKTAQMMLEMGQNPPLNPSQMEQILTPVLLTIGDKDQMVSIDETRHISHLLPHAQCIVLKDIPHSIEQIDAAFLAESIHHFF
ncbi:alpha/beta hydrolase [Flavobacterium sp. CYK-55]|uniref:alpha/beta fold hydrolase n=1 Tax=Flavobacterium sp. CYK-55 TaxID=2835529 RepID=UPI001BCFDCAF|nr:alpha/beta hydrolase [Flavobacterium sp. CYK-55]MBS7787614.1 alpha/beta hydrolase [Flavobacterium sp. CYK-55]